MNTTLDSPAYDEERNTSKGIHCQDPTWTRDREGEFRREGVEAKGEIDGERIIGVIRRAEKINNEGKYRKCRRKRRR